MHLRIRSILSVWLLLASLGFLATVSAYAQVLEVCTISPAPPSCETDQPACTAAQATEAGKHRGEWRLSCTVNTTKDAPTQKQLNALDESFKLPQLPPIKLCDATMKPSGQAVPLDVPTLIARISSSDYTLTSQGNYVVIISKTAVTPPSTGSVPPPTQTLNELNATMKLLLQTLPANSNPFAVELAMPHAAAFGSTLAAQITGISSLFAAKPTGRDRIAITTLTGLPPTCADWQTFLGDLRELAWSVHPESTEMRLTALDAASTATALGTGSSSANSASPAATTAAPAAATPAAGSAQTASSASSAAAAPALTITVTPPAPAGTKPAPGAAASASTTATTITVAQAPPAAPAAAPPAAAPAAASVAGAATPGVSIGSIEPDLLVFSDSNPGDDAQITEKKRMVAILDLPRPEMSISAWVMQNSSTDPDSVNQSSQRVRQEVRTYNDGLETTILKGWQYLQSSMSKASYFDPAFYNYIARRVIFDGHRSIPEGETSSIQQTAHDFLNEQSAASDSIEQTSENVAPDAAHFARQDYLGACGQAQYCLGYTTLFHPIKPRLTDLMLALIAANNPPQEVNCAVDRSEGAANPTVKDACPSDSDKNLAYDPTALHKCTEDGYARPCEIWAELNPTRDHAKKPLPPVDPRTYPAESCEERDYLGVLQSMLRQNPTGRPQPVMFLNCFRETAAQLFSTETANGTSVTQLGLMRAAIADFLFNYKMSQQYPHEFVAYDLTTSAQAMNTAIRPLVDAFVRDVTAYQTVLKRKLGLQIKEMNKHLTASSVFDKPRFFNNAIVTVNTIASSEASVDTTVESYLEALNPPTLSALAGALSGATGATTSTSTSNPAALNSLVGATRFNEAQMIAAGLTQYVSSRIHIGRELSVDVKPESLLGANSAELQVTLKADDEAGSGSYSSGGSGDAEVSRFGKSDTTTRIRVDSLKLFEVSAFASQLAVPKKRFPLLPIPGLEMPYFGSILSVPVRPAREFHISMAVMSAIVIPTAADLAFSARFVGDRLLAPENLARDSNGDMTEPCVWPTDAKNQDFAKRPPCRTRSMVSLRDFNGKPVREFNRMMTHCLATGGTSAIPNLIPGEKDPAKGTCATLSFSDVLGDSE